MTEASTRPAGQQVSVATDAGPMPALLWLPPSGRGPGLVLLQEIFGVSPYIRRRGADLAAEGYVVLAPDLYWRLGGDELDESQPDAIEQAMGLVQQLDWDTTVADSVAALDALRGREEVAGRTGVIGFCFGGGLGFNVAAVSDPDALVSYYGSSVPGLLDLTPQVSAPSLHHYGLADQYIDRVSVDAVRRAVTAGPGTVQFETYDGADHAFDNPDFSLHHPDASAQAWERTLEFLHRELPTS